MIISFFHVFGRVNEATVDNKWLLNTLHPVMNCFDSNENLNNPKTGTLYVFVTRTLYNYNDRIHIVRYFLRLSHMLQTIYNEYSRIAE